MAKIISKEEARAAYNTAPEAIRNAFNSEATMEAIQNIRNTYGLHVDIAGELGKEVGYMLLGLLSPSEFFGDLILAGIDEKNARIILEELNTKIFIPLQRSIKTPDSPEEQLKRKKMLVETPSVAFNPTAQAEPPINSSTPSYNLIHSQMGSFSQKPVSNPVETPINIPAEIPHSSQATPARSFQTSSVPFNTLSTPVPVNSPVVFPVTESVPLPKPTENSGPKTSSSGDPYRESIL